MKEEIDKICDKILNKKTMEICLGKIIKQYWGDETIKYTCEKCGNYQVKYEWKKKS